MADAPNPARSGGPASAAGRSSLPEWMTGSVLGLTGTQFLGAFNDNLYKTLVLLLFVRLDGSDQQALAFGIFALPFILFSGIAGELSERHSKSRIIVWMKWAEVGIMLAAVGAFVMASPVLLLVVLFVMGTQSTFFGPAKYAILPEFVATKYLIPVNGLVVMTTFLAILTGQTLAGPLVDQLGDRLWIGSLACVGVALLGVFTATRIQRTQAQRPDDPIPMVSLGVAGIRVVNPFAGLWGTWGAMRQEPAVLGAVLLYCVFWFDAGVINQSVIGMHVPGCLDLAKDQNWIITVGLLGTTSVAIAIGSALAAKIGTLVPPGRVVATGGVLTLIGQTSLLLVGPVVPSSAAAVWVALACVGTAGIGAGLFSVPLVAYIQRAPQPGQKGRAVAFNNWVNFVAIFLAAPFYGTFVGFGALPTAAAAAAGIVLVVALVVFRSTLREMTFEGDE